MLTSAMLYPKYGARVLTSMFEVFDNIHAYFAPLGCSLRCLPFKVAFLEQVGDRDDRGSSNRGDPFGRFPSKVPCCVNCQATSTCSIPAMIWDITSWRSTYLLYSQILTSIFENSSNTEAVFNFSSNFANC